MKLNTKIQGQGYPILCLHGHPGSANSMSVFTNTLSQQYQTIAPDLRGYGKSHSQGKFQMEDHITDLQELLDEYQIKECLLLGWSLGGILALELALRDPQRFKGLILVASAANPLSNHPPVTTKDLLFTAIAGIINYVKPGWLWNINTFGKRSLFRYLINQQTPQAYYYLAQEGVPAYLQTSSTANQALSNALSNRYNRLKDLYRITIPCLILAGEKDRHITFHSSQKTAKQISNCQFIAYQNTAHLFPWEVPRQVLEDIKKWLNNV